ncbi:MAG TPA: Holliday junction resolvase RuvX [Verrucomicrobiae bacterium]|nr:Holliday junction resolvase RuvX [Verrucomicrobiae bacterium]
MTGVYLAFDYGTKRIGVAIGDAVTRGARGLGAVGEDWNAIDGLIREWRPQACVVGLPVGRDSEEQPITQRARAFAQRLQERFEGPVHLCDERYSSRAGLDDLRRARASGAMKRRVRTGDKDSAAARVILEQWLGENRD